MILNKNVIPIYEPNDIYKVIEELNRGARELGKLTLEEQTKRAEKLTAGWRNRQTRSVVGRKSVGSNPTPAAIKKLFMIFRISRIINPFSRHLK